jgi:uncharacterized protein
MKLIDTRTGIEWLERAECLERLARHEIGRLAVVDGSRPHILPVNYRLDGEAIVFRTAVGLKLDAVGRAPVAFEIDDFDRKTRSGWSVVVSGRLEEVEPASEKGQRLRRLPVEPWAQGAKDHWVRLVPDRITGRIVRPPAPEHETEEEQA